MPYYDISKLKLIFTEPIEQNFKLKINYKNEEIIFWASYQQEKHKEKEIHEAFYLFASIIASKMALMGKKIAGKIELNSKGIPEQVIKNSQFYGKLLKKSRVISRWNEIFVVINSEGLIYFKKIGDKPELLVPRGSVKELWTRFEFQDGWLIVKLFQGSHKIELGVPLTD